MRKIFHFFITLIILVSCNSGEQKASESTSAKGKAVEPTEENYVKNIDLDQIKEKGVLRALTVYSPSNYFLYKGFSMGFEYELLNNFSEYLGVDLQIIRVNNLDEVIPMLKRGEGDIIAHGLTVTEDRKKEVSFTDYHRLTHQVLVQRKPENWRKMTLDEIDDVLVRNVIELLNDTVSIRKNSSYLERINNIMKETGGTIYIDTIHGKYSTEAIIEMVAKGDVKYTIADNNIADINKTNFSNIDVFTKLSLSQRISWSVRKDSPNLREEVNFWLKEIKKSGYFNIVFNKYYKNSKQYKKRIRSEYFSLKTGKISKYDDLVKEYSEKLGWDWRMLSSQIFQESKFDHDKKSWTGAEGLMQLMPKTAQSLGMTNNTPEENVKAGTKYLKQIYGKWEDIPDSIQRMKFTLASYNCGYAHVRDAQKLAKREKTDSTRWDEGISKYILMLSNSEYYNLPEVKYGYVRGRETYNYVEEIFDRYNNYKEFVEE